MRPHKEVVMVTPRINTYNVFATKRGIVIDINKNGKPDPKDPVMLIAAVDPNSGEMAPEFRDALEHAQPDGTVILKGDVLKKYGVINKGDDFVPLKEAFSNDKEKAVDFEAKIKMKGPKEDPKQPFKIGELKVYTVDVNGEKWNMVK